LIGSKYMTPQRRQAMNAVTYGCPGALDRDAVEFAPTA
jgi:hypothetical protein